MQVRTPAVAGAFYPDNKEKLKDSIRNCFLHELGPGKIPPSCGEKILGAICPHAGYMYSGPVACHSFYAMSSSAPELFIIVGPNHWSLGRDFATASDCTWSTPLGEVKVDTTVARRLSEISCIKADLFSHTKEHSIEVMLPILQEFFEDFEIVPISLISQDIESASAVGTAMADVAKTRDTTIIGSSDFTHYEPNDFAHKQDRALIEPILRLDVDEFYDILDKKKVSACGYGAIASTMIACKKLGASKGRLLRYATSGDVTGDTNSVVGYASIIFT